MTDARSSSEAVALIGTTLIALVCVEATDGARDVGALERRLRSMIGNARPADLPVPLSWPVEKVLLVPFAHLSEFASTNRRHVTHILTELQEALSKSGGAVFMVGTDATNALFADLALFDSIISSKCSLTPSSLVSDFRGLLNAFGYDTVSRALEKARQRPHDENEIT